MANTRSAEKRNRQASKRRASNSAVRSTVKNAIKKVREAVAKNDPAAGELLRQATKTIDKAATKGVVHTRTASRKVSRLASAVRASAAAK